MGQPGVRGGSCELVTWASGSTGWGRSRGARASVCSVTRGSTGPPSVGAGRVPRGHVRDGLHGEWRRRSRLGAAEPRAVTRVTAGAPTGLVGCDAAQGRGALTSPRCARRGQNRHVPRRSSARRGRIPEPVPVPSRQPSPRPRFCSGPSSWTQAKDSGTRRPPAQLGEEPRARRAHCVPQRRLRLQRDPRFLLGGVWGEGCSAERAPPFGLGGGEARWLLRCLGSPRFSGCCVACGRPRPVI